jgi:hypothetical protein
MFASSSHFDKILVDMSNKPLLIVGNGPSLNNVNLDQFEGINAIGMNKIDLIFNRTKWRPNLIVCLNNLVAKQHETSFIKSQIPVLMAWKCRWMLKNRKNTIFNYFNLSVSNKFSYNVKKEFGSSATVSYIAMQLAYFIKANPIILIGIDHNFKYDGPDSSYQIRTGIDINHFDPNYFQAGGVWATPDLVQSELDYSLAKNAFENRGIRIYDATLDGKLKIFQKISLEDALIILKNNE